MTASRLYTEQVEAALKDLKILMRVKFEKKEFIFDYVWKSLEKENNSLEGLDSYYTLTIKGLKDKIDQLVKNKKIDVKKINFTDSDIIILEKMLALRQVLARHYFICSQLNKYDKDRIDHELKNLLFDCSDIIKTFEELDLPSKKIFIQQLNEVTDKISATLQKKKFLDEGTDYPRINSLEVNTTAEIKLILENLILMPDLVEINEDNWQDLVEEIGTCHTSIHGALTSLFSVFEKIAKALNSINHRIQNKTDDIAVKKEIAEYYAWLLKLNLKTNEKLVSDLEEAANQLAAACKDSNVLKAIPGFAGTSDKLHDRFVSTRNTMSLLNRFKEFTASHEKLMGEVEELSHQNNVLSEKYAQGKAAVNDIHHKLKNAKNSWSKSSDAVVITYNELHKKYSPTKAHSFFKRHWWKIALGTIIGGAIATVAAYFLLPALVLTVMSIVTFALCIGVGLLVGGAIAAGIAKLVDTCLPKTAVVIPMATHRPDVNFTFDWSDESSEEETPDLTTTETVSISVPPPSPRPLPPTSAPIPIPKPATSPQTNPTLGVSWINPFTWFGKSGQVDTTKPAMLEEGKRNAL